MQKSIFLLEQNDNPKIIRAFQLFLGIVCIGIAVFWTIFNLSSGKTDGSTWITVLFLLAFGSYMILAGLGKNTRFIEILNDRIKLKQHSVLPPVVLNAPEIQKIEIYPLSTVFIAKDGKKIILRFGVTHHELIGPAKDGICLFAGNNSIPFEIRDEEV